MIEDLQERGDVSVKEGEPSATENGIYVMRILYREFRPETCIHLDYS